MGLMPIEKSSNFIVKSKRKKSMIKNLNLISKPINLSLHQLSVNLGLKIQYTLKTQIIISRIPLKKVINKPQSKEKLIFPKKLNKSRVNKNPKILKRKKNKISQLQKLQIFNLKTKIPLLKSVSKVQKEVTNHWQRNILPLI